MSKSKFLAVNFIASARKPSGYSAGEIVEFIGWSASGDGGAAQWVATGNQIAASQTPALLGTTKCSDANGNEFELVFGSTLILEKLGGVDALQAALNSKAPEVAWFSDSLALNAVTYTMFSGQHLHGPGIEKCTVVINSGMPLDQPQFINEAPNISTDGVRYDKNIKISGFTIDCSNRVYPAWLSQLDGTPITDPEFDYSPSGIIGQGGDIFDVVNADRRNPNYSTIGQVFRFIKVDSPEVANVRILSHESLGITDEGCKDMLVHHCEFIDCGKIDNISSPVWAQSYGTPGGGQVFYADTENHITEHCYFECKRSAITLNPTLGGSFRFNSIGFNGESAVFSGSQANYSGGRIDVHNNTFGPTTLTDIAAQHVESNGNADYHVYNNEFTESDLESVNVIGNISASVHNNTFKNVVQKSTVNYPYGPFSESYAFNVGQPAIAGTTLPDRGMIETGTLNSVGCDGLSIYENHFIDDRVTSLASGIVALARSGDANKSKNIVIRNNYRSLVADTSIPMINDDVTGVLDLEMSISCYANVADASEIASKQIIQIPIAASGLQTVDVGFRPRQVLIRAALNSGSLGASYNGSMHWAATRQDCGVYVNTNNVGWSSVIDNEFYRLTDELSGNIARAEFADWLPTGFRFNVIESTEIANLQLICIA